MEQVEQRNPASHVRIRGHSGHKWKPGGTPTRPNVSPGSVGAKSAWHTGVSNLATLRLKGNVLLNDAICHVCSVYTPLKDPSSLECEDTELTRRNYS